jgi:hypothetical protein
MSVSGLTTGMAAPIPNQDPPQQFLAEEFFKNPAMQ